MFIDKLIEKIDEKSNPSVVGLDPVLDYLPEFLVKESFAKYGQNLKGCANAIWEFNKAIIDEVFDIVPSVKLQLGCYEMYGIEGMIVFEKTAKYAREKNLLVIADGKRNDIDSSAKCYSNAYLGKTKIQNIEERAFEVDALTINPYLGEDGIRPFIQDCKDYEKGVFVLVKTSNKSSGQLQDLIFNNGDSLYLTVAKLVNEWGSSIIGKWGYSSVGAVVGATYPQQAKVLRQQMKKTYFLVPGFGAQGGAAKDIANAFNEDGKGAIINASRSIMCAYRSDMWKTQFQEEDFAKAARMEAIRMRDEINSVIK